MRSRWVALSVVVAVAATGCLGATSRGAALPRPSATESVSRSPSAGRLATHKPSRAAVVPGWALVSSDAHGVVIDRRTFFVGPGTAIVLMRLRAGQTAYVLHAGSFDPGRRAYRLGVTARSVISTKERSRLVAAFTG